MVLHVFILGGYFANSNLNNMRLFFLTLWISCLAYTQTGIRLEVVDIEGQPVSGAFVEEVNNLFKGKTDKNGYATFTGITTGRYIINVTAEGFEDIVRAVDVRNLRDPEVHIVLRYAVSEMPQIDIVERKNGIFSNTPGSISVMDRKAIEKINPVSGNEVFRQMPGVHVVDEEGMGMRINVGIRGLDPDRGRNVLILEDGIPVALAPYGEPEMYFTPAMERMERVEVLKGSGSILHGPQTIGGVINYVTKDPPAKETVRAGLRGGSGGLASGMIEYGNTFDKTGVVITGFHKRAEDIGTSEFELTDITAKLRFQTGEKSTIGVKLGFYDERSNSTYVGLTQSMFDAGGQDFVRIAPDDELQVRRYSISATHHYRIAQNTKLKTTAFGYTTTRNWRRQDFALNNLDADGNVSNYPSNFSGVIWGDTTVAQGALLMRNSTGNRNRQFEVGGFESRLNHHYQVAQLDNDLTVGGRILYERAYEQRVNGTNPQLSSGNLRDEEIRTGYGTSFFAQNQLHVNNRFSLTGGVRTELFDYERDIFRANFVDTNINNISRVFQVIPGAGINYNLDENNLLFAGVHKGFAPPRIKDAIASDGEDRELDAELSWSYEAGYRTKMQRGINLELTAFYMDFSNQVIPVAESAGGLGVGLVNGGETIHAGIEIGSLFEIHKMLNTKGEKIYVNLNYTHVISEFTGERYADTLTNVAGNRTPYAPQHLLNGALTYESKTGLGARVSYTYVSEQFTDLRNTVTPSNNGRNGLIDAYQIIDLTVMYRIKPLNTVITASVKNLTDERFIASRRPQGIRVGNPRLFTVGVNWSL